MWSVSVLYQDDVTGKTYKREYVISSAYGALNGWENAKNVVAYSASKAVEEINRKRVQMKRFVFDVETGGVDPTMHSLLTLAGVVWEDGEVRDKIDLVIAERPVVVETSAMEINKIDLDWLQRVGDSPLVAARKLEDFLRPHFGQMPVPLAGHNVGFDYSYLQRLYRLAYAEYTQAAQEPGVQVFNERRINRIFSYRLLDTQSVAAFLELAGIMRFPNGLSQASVAEALGVKWDKDAAHNALYDAGKTAEVLSRLVEVTRPHEVA